MNGAPPLMSRQRRPGAVSTCWRFAARLEAAGAETVLSVDKAVAYLGLSPTPR